MPLQSHTQDTNRPPNFRSYEKAMKFMQDLLWKQPRECFLPCCLIAFVAYTCNITLFGPNMGEFWMQSRFPTVPSSYDTQSRSSFFLLPFQKEKGFPFCCSIKNLITRQTGCESWLFPVWAQQDLHIMARRGIRLKEVEAAPEPCAQHCRVPSSPPPALETPNLTPKRQQRAPSRWSHWPQKAAGGSWAGSISNRAPQSCFG